VNSDTAIHLAVQALMMTLKISLPFLIAGLLVGLVISVFQAATHIQEITLTFIPKILATGLVMVVAGPWMLREMVGYTRDLYLSIPSLVG
jgi:flagellar biosynthetic protein FliQ